VAWESGLSAPFHFFGGNAMIKVISSKTIENLRDGMKEGVDTAWKASKRMQFRSPVVYDRPFLARTSGWLGIGILSAAAMALGAWLYFRKRKEVSDRYTMGEGPGANWESDKVPVGEQIPTPSI
jgi:hypothetical protein